MRELWVPLSGAIAQQRQVETIANNVANANTHGYKRLDVQFEELVSRPKTHATASYVTDRGLFVDFETGSFENTHNPLDLAINGEGFFAIQVGETVQYTRKGQFLLSADGTLVTPSGHTVLDNAGAPIQVPQDATNIMVARDGTISSADGAIAQVGLFSFADEDLNKLQRTGDSNFLPQLGAAAVPVEAPSMRQGMLESSNVNAVQEMVTMQDVSKKYQNALKLMQGLEELETRAIQTLGKYQ